MPTYELSGLQLESSITLTLAASRRAASAPNEGRVRIQRGAGSPPEPACWRVRRMLDGCPWLSVAAEESGHVLRFHGLGDFWISSDASELVCWQSNDCDADTFEHLLVDQVVPQLLHLRGKPSFHASAVEMAGGVAAFLGLSGSGKSTLAACLGSSSHAFVCDDCLALSLEADSVVAYPSYPVARLHEETATRLTASAEHRRPTLPKVRVRMRQPSGARRLCRMYVLADGSGGPKLEALGRRDAIVEVARHLDRVDPGDRARLSTELQQLERIVTLVPVRRLSYERSFDRLPAVAGAIEDDMAKP